MTNTPTGDISRLPKWAQRLIQRQEREIDSLKDSVSLMEGVIAETKPNSMDIDTDVWIQRFDPDDIPLPKGSTVLFGDRSHHFSVTLGDDGQLEVRTSWGPIDLRPEASNSVKIALRERSRR